MPIQFSCPSCNQPIEVDDQFAEQTAACPYCSKVVNIPRASSLSAAAVTTARPVPPPAPAYSGGYAQHSPAPDLHVGPRPPSYRVAAKYGNYGLLCCVLIFLLATATGIYFIKATFDHLGWDMYDQTATQPTQQEMLEAEQHVMSHDPWVTGGAMLVTLISVIGLVLGIASLRSTARGNWRGIFVVVICSIFTFCCFSTLTVSLLGP